MFLRAFLTAALLVASAAPATALCEPDCSSSGAGDKVEDPRNCTRYYVCVDVNEPSAYPVACQPPLSIFDPVVAECVEGVQCSPSCNPPRCDLRCDAVLDIIPSPWNCNVYYYCDAGYSPGAPQYCPENRPYFDGELCVSDSSVCCEVPCEPYCGPGDVQTPDPDDCTMYYICVEEGTPTQENHHSCDPGATFQPTSQVCVMGGECYYLCGTTTTTTTTSTTITTTTTPTTTPSDCIQFLTCPSSGNFSRCITCQPGYFQCDGEGLSGKPMLCESGLVFNTDPGYPYCIPEAMCPYTPTTTTTSTTTEECVSSFTCPSSGYFPMCSTCQEGYFVCEAEGMNGIVELCPPGTVFNTIPGCPFCVDEQDCPMYCI